MPFEIRSREDSVNLFQAGLREYLGSYMNPAGGGWEITGLSVTASKIVAVPSGTSSITRYFHGQDRFRTSSEPSDENFAPKDDNLSPSRTESHSASHHIECGREQTPISHDTSTFDQYETACKDEATESCLTSKHEEPQPRLPEKERNVNDGKRSYEQKRKATKEKGTSSILRFLQTNSCSSSNQETKCSISGVQEALGMESEGLTESQNKRRTNSWRYNVDEIDQSVVEELPREIQEEVRTWLRPQKQANTVKRGSSIAHYFFPNRNEHTNLKKS